MAAELRYVLCDVFTDRPLAGSPLAVFTDARAIPERLLQPLARELGLPRTVFCYAARAGGHVRLRIFTPARELPLAGDAVLGAAFVLAAPLQLAEIVLETGAGPIPVALAREGPRLVFGWMCPPLPALLPFGEGPALVRALGVDRATLPVARSAGAPGQVLVALGSAAEVRALAPDLAALGRLVLADAVSCFAAEGRRVTARVFAPGAGAAGDAAAAALACHLARHGRLGLGETVEIVQGVETGRPSTLHARVAGTPDRLERVEVGGAAVTVARGEFRLDLGGR